MSISTISIRKMGTQLTTLTYSKYLKNLITLPQAEVTWRCTEYTLSQAEVTWPCTEYTLPQAEVTW